jgi:hypothetical protein
VTVALLAAAAFLLVLAFLTLQLGGLAAGGTRPMLVRRIYETTVVERVPAGTPGGTSVTQSSSTPYSTGAVPVTGSSR